MSTPINPPPQSGSTPEPDLPPWDIVGRALVERLDTFHKMLDFWNKLSVKSRWVAELRGWNENTITFTYDRASGRYADIALIDELVFTVHKHYGTAIVWSAHRFGGGDRICLYGVTPDSFGLVIWTPWDNPNHLPAWVQRS